MVVDEYECILIDTPGYDDTSRSDVEILRKIADFFEVCMRNKHMLSGVLYLHRITDNRVGHIAAKNIRMFAKLCGPGVMSNVVLCTTMWEEVDPVVGESREKELCESFWKEMITAGAKVMRHDGTEESALEVVRELLPLPPIVLQLQDELVNQHLALPDTAAGQEIGQDLAGAMEAHKLEMTRLHDELSKAQERDIRGIQDDLAREHSALRARADELRLLLQKRDEEVMDLTRRVADSGSRFWTFLKSILDTVLPLIVTAGRRRIM
ncbi:hypothetical protein AURDEDRAFT_112048 [Auricularia subglabra TFB-10046 SS5]|nr:hypothetical protein AURDEDRAFT_112048 [Auricularia subglabra TFB-10046 SS5]